VKLDLQVVMMRELVVIMKRKSEEKAKVGSWGIKQSGALYDGRIENTWNGGWWWLPTGNRDVEGGTFTIF
jgi:hypothetical protein